MGTLLADIGETKVWRRSRGAHSDTEASRFGDLAELAPDVRRDQACRWPRRRPGHEPATDTGREPILSLALAVLPEGLDGGLGQRLGWP